MDEGVEVTHREVTHRERKIKMNRLRILIVALACGLAVLFVKADIMTQAMAAIRMGGNQLITRVLLRDATIENTTLSGVTVDSSTLTNCYISTSTVVPIVTLDQSFDYGNEIDGADSGTPVYIGTGTPNRLAMYQDTTTSVLDSVGTLSLNPSGGTVTIGGTVAVTGTVDQYVRAQIASGTFSSITFAVSFARHLH